MAIVPSKYQQAIYDFVELSEANGIVQAVAGSGKTTTIENAIRNNVPAGTPVILAAFNKHIAISAQSRMPMNVVSTTINGFGWRAAVANGYIKLDDEKIDKILRFDVLKVPRGDKEANKVYYKVLRPLKKIIGLIKARGERNLSSYDDIISTHAIDTPRDMELFKDYVNETLQYSIKKTKTYDFNDQVYMPFIHDIELPQFPLGFVDETQDLNPLQIMFMQRVCKRIIGVGDRHQAIYGFRGADPWAMDLFAKTYNATTLPLSVCYRCAKNIVKQAQLTVPSIEYADWAEEGVVDEILSHQMMPTDKDFILCRTTAPLVASCLRFLRDGIKAVVLGKDVGDDIVAFVQVVSNRFSTIEIFKRDLDIYNHAKTKRLTELNKTYELAAHNDKVETVEALLEDTKLVLVDDLIKKIEGIFSDESQGIPHATIHKSKGLEADRVFVLKPELSPHPAAKLEWQVLQEQNLKYVRDTRARRELYFVK